MSFMTGYSEIYINKRTQSKLKNYILFKSIINRQKYFLFHLLDNRKHGETNTNYRK